MSLQQTRAKKTQRGFSLIELMIVVLVFSILFAITVPSLNSVTQSLRVTADTRAVAAQLHLARMRAAALGTKTRLNVNVSANTYQLEVWDKTSSAYTVEGGTQNLSQGVSFSYGSITVPAGQQSTIAEGYTGETGCGCIYFNSRGIATDSSGNATANSAIYLTNNRGSYAVTVSIAGQPRAYVYRGSAWGLY